MYEKVMYTYHKMVHCTRWTALVEPRWSPWSQLPQEEITMSLERKGVSDPAADAPAVPAVPAAPAEAAPPEPSPPPEEAAPPEPEEKEEEEKAETWEWIIIITLW